MKKVLKFLGVILALVAVVSLASCAPKDGAAAKAKLEKKGYDVVVDNSIQPAALKLLTGYTVVTVVEASKDNGKDKDADSVVAVLFTSSKDAKAALAKIQDSKDKGAKVSGSWVYYGTEKGMKAFA